VVFGRPVPILDGRRWARRVFCSRQDAAGRSSGGQNRPQDLQRHRALHLEVGRTLVSPVEAHSTEDPLSCYRLRSIGRELEVCLGAGRQQEAVWLSKGGFRWRVAGGSRRHAGQTLRSELSRAKDGPQQCPWAGPLRMRCLVQLPTQFLVHLWVHCQDEAFVLHGKASGRPHTADGDPGLILRWAARSAVPQKPAVPVSLIQSTQLLVCPAADPTALLHAPPDVERRLSCLFPQWFSAGSRVLGDVRGGYPHPFLDDRAGQSLVCPWAGADLSTLSVSRELWLPALELGAGRRKQPALQGGRAAMLDASALGGDPLSGQ
jgi:hypothetical protein